MRINPELTISSSQGSLFSSVSRPITTIFEVWTHFLIACISTSLHWVTSIMCFAKIKLKSMSVGFIDVGDKCWRRNVLATTIRCWWRLWSQHPNIVTNVTSPTSRCHYATTPYQAAKNFKSPISPIIPPLQSPASKISKNVFWGLIPSEQVPSSPDLQDSRMVSTRVDWLTCFSNKLNKRLH